MGITDYRVSNSALLGGPKMFSGYTTTKEYSNAVHKQFEAVVNGASPFTQPPLPKLRRISIAPKPIRPQIRLLPFQLA